MATATSLVISDNVKLLVVDFTCDAAYPTGGYAFTPVGVGLTDIFGVDIVGNHPGVTCSYQLGKLLLYGTGSANQAKASELAANSTAVSAATKLRLLVIGR
jgi:hypothetical protein